MLRRVKRLREDGREEVLDVGVGARLRQIRKERGCSLESIATRTRIPPRILTAIEREEFHAVPSGIFLRGYLRAFATEVGLDPDEVVRAYGAEQAPSPPEEVRYAESDGLAPGGGERGPDRRLTWVFVFTGAAVLLMVVFLWPRGDAGLSAPLLDGDADAMTATGGDGELDLTPVSTANAPAVAPTARPGSAAASSPGSSDGVEATLVAREAVWVGATADGGRVLFRTLEAGERVTLKARRQLEVRAGNAGVLDLAVGGQPPRPLGRQGQVRTVTLRQQGGRIVVE
jgi:cytoskeleton protein RodZ